MKNTIQKTPALKARKVDIAMVIPYIVFVAIVIVMGILKPSTLSLYFLGIKCDLCLPLILIATGQTMVLIAKGIDLSVGGVMSMATCIMATVSEKSLILALALCVVMGLAVGCINGLLISKFKLQPFVATLGTWTVMRGLSLVLLRTDGGYIPAEMTKFLIKRMGGVPVSLVIIILLAIIWYVVKKTPFVTSIYAVGSNEKAAFMNGVNTNKVKVGIYALSGLFAALGGVVYAGINATGSPTVGEGNIMMSVAAAVLGGTSLNGGRGNLYGSIIGVIILKLISDILIFAGVTSYWTSLFQGLLLIVSVVMGSVSALLKQKRSLKYD